MNKIFVDTGYVVALLNSRDADHAVASELAIEFADASLVTTDAVLLEIGNALSRAFKPQAIELIDEFLTSDSIEIIHMNEDLFCEGLKTYRDQPEKTFGLVDCISFATMRRLGITDALTQDKHYMQAGLRSLMLDENLIPNFLRSGR